MRRLVKGILLLVLSIAPFVAAQASRVEPIQNTADQSLSRADGKPLTLEQVKKGVLAGGSRQHRLWALNHVKDGAIVAKLEINGRHFAVADITYTATGYSVKYRESTNLNFEKDENGVDVIHHNYNRSVRNLQKSIEQAVRNTQD